MAKIIGVLHGKERSFPEALVKRINEKKIKGISAAPVKIDKVIQGDPSGYAVIIDRISQDVPFYRAFLKNAAISGTAVINNPFWWSADEKFFNNALATKIGVPVPKTVILPSRELPDDTSAESFSNLTYPLDWKGIFDYVGFPAYMKPFAGGGWKNVYRLNDMDEFLKDMRRQVNWSCFCRKRLCLRNITAAIASAENMSASCLMSRATLITSGMLPISNLQPKC